MLAFTFHTGGKYSVQADQWKASASSVGLDTLIIERPDLGTWWQNCNQKCEVVSDVLKQYGNIPILWNDTDIRYVSYPKVFDALEEDLAMFFFNRNVPSGGVIYLGGESKCRKYVDAWIANVNLRPEYDDDAWNFGPAVKSIRPRSIYHLTPSYCWNEKSMRSVYPTTMPVILHEYIGKRDYPATLDGRTV